jgi:GntR family transcriptional regulator
MTEPQVPAYLHVANKIRADIESGSLAQGTKLPSLEELAKTHGVNRGVAERAINQLRLEGLLVVRQGSGALVQRYERIPRVSPDRLKKRWRDDHAIQDHDTGDRWRSVTTDIGEMPAPDWAARPLKVQAGEPVVYRSRRFLVDGRAVQLSTSYLPVELARGTPIMHMNPGERGIYGRLAERGFEPTEFVESVIARVPTKAELEELDLVRRDSVVFEITRTAYAEDRCVEVNRMVLDGKAYQLVYKFSSKDESEPS